MFILSGHTLRSDKRQRKRLNSKPSASVDGASGVFQDIVLGLLLFILYTSELFHPVGNHNVGYANDATIYAVISQPLSRPQVMESLNQDLTASNC